MCEGEGYSIFCYFTEVEQLLSNIFVLLDCSFVVSFARKSRFLLEVSWPVPFGIPRLLHSSTPSLEYMNEKKNQRIHHHVIC